MSGGEAGGPAGLRLKGEQRKTLSKLKAVGRAESVGLGSAGTGRLTGSFVFRGDSDCARLLGERPVKTE